MNLLFTPPAYRIFDKINYTEKAAKTIWNSDPWHEFAVFHYICEETILLGSFSAEYMNDSKVYIKFDDGIFKDREFKNDVKYVF
jgi:hypothetical protein